MCGRHVCGMRPNHAGRQCVGGVLGRPRRQMGLPGIHPAGPTTCGEPVVRAGMWGGDSARGHWQGAMHHRGHGGARPGVADVENLPSKSGSGPSGDVIGTDGLGWAGAGLGVEDWDGGVGGDEPYEQWLTASAGEFVDMDDDNDDDDDDNDDENFYSPQTNHSSQTNYSPQTPRRLEDVTWMRETFPPGGGGREERD